MRTQGLPLFGVGAYIVWMGESAAMHVIPQNAAIMTMSYDLSIFLHTQRGSCQAVTM